MSCTYLLPDVLYSAVNSDTTVADNQRQPLTSDIGWSTTVDNTKTIVLQDTVFHHAKIDVSANANTGAGAVMNIQTAPDLQSPSFTTVLTIPLDQATGTLEETDSFFTRIAAGTGSWEYEQFDNTIGMKNTAIYGRAGS